MGTWWWKWSSILKVLKVTSSQCLYNVSKKKLWMEFSIFHVSYQFLMKVARHVQSTKKGSLLNFSNILRKVLQRLLCSIGMQNIQILYWIPVMFVVTYFWVAVVKKFLDHWTLKSAVSQESEWIKWTDFFACWYKFRNANVNLAIIGWKWSKMGSYKVLIIWDSKIRCISHIIWLIKQIYSIISGVTTNLLCIFDIC